MLFGSNSISNTVCKVYLTLLYSDIEAVENYPKIDKT